MDILITYTTSASQPLFKGEMRDNYDPGELASFREAMGLLVAEAEKMGVQHESGVERKHETRSNSEHGPKYYGGGVDIFTTIQTISLIVASPVLFVQFLKAVSPIVKQIIENRGRRSIDVKVGDIHIKVEDPKDLEKAIELAKRLEKERPDRNED